MLYCFRILLRKVGMRIDRNHWVMWPAKVLVRLFRRLFLNPRQMCRRQARFDCAQLCRTAWVSGRLTREGRLADIVWRTHVIEKGLTMPNRRLNFGHQAIHTLAERVDAFRERFGDAPQVMHAVAVLRAYACLHDEMARQANATFWSWLEAWLARAPQTEPAIQPHVTRDAFYAQRLAPFDAFARSRHVLRSYAWGGVIDAGRLRSAVALAFEVTPSACNRQHARVHCVAEPAQRTAVLAQQAGNRGFGHLADKVLVVTVDLDDILWPVERRDVFVNGGLLLMSLCYALHFYEIAHCILSCAFLPEQERALRKLLALRETEVPVAILTCGLAPAEFDVASSARRPLDEVYFEH